VAVTLAVAAGLLAMFVVFAAFSGTDSALSAWDRRVWEAFIAWRTLGRSRLFWVATLLGNTPVLAALSFSAVVLLALWGRRAAAALVAVGLLIGWGVSEAAKNIVARPRPPAGDALIAVPTSAAMPSGHALTTLVFFGLLLYLAFRWNRRGARGWVFTAAAAAIVVAGLIGVSRAYLGVHWLSDVLSGWVLGGAWLAAFIAAVCSYRRSPRRFVRLDAFLSRRPPARAAVRAVAAVLLVMLCVAAIVLSARADPLLAAL
jgi:membrane-associated phospholipid phosphatase